LLSIYYLRSVYLITAIQLLKAVRSSTLLSVVESWAVKAATSEESLQNLSDDAILQSKVRCAENPSQWILLQADAVEAVNIA
jgi:hypothetical protein